MRLPLVYVRSFFVFNIGPKLDFSRAKLIFLDFLIHPDQDANKNTIIALSITIVAIVIMATIVVIAIMIIIKYRRSKFITPSPESENLLQEPRSSRCVRVVC